MFDRSVLVGMNGQRDTSQVMSPARQTAQVQYTVALNLPGRKMFETPKP